jgi:subtilisin family serine protease
MIARFLAVLAFVAIGCSGGGPAGPGPDPGPDPPGDAVPDQVLVRLTPVADVAGINARHGTRTIATIESQRVYLLGIPDDGEVDEVLAALRLDPAISSASANGRASAPEAQGRSTMAFADPSLQAADRVDQQALARIRAPEAWTRGRGAGIVVAVLDTGVDTGHPQLAGRIAPGAADLVDGDADPSDRPDGIDSDGDDLVDEAVGHGTFVAGLVATVAPDARILPIRILDSDGAGTAVVVARGVEIAVQRGARVINMSLGMEIESDVLEEMIDELARDRGIVFVSSAGNAGSDRPQYPAGQNEVMAVAATTPGDAKAEFSNWGSWVSVSAPGEGLVSLLPATGMGRWSGTSFASALASGEAAILIGFAPFARSDEVRKSIEDSAIELADARLNGAGRIDVVAALDLLEERLGLGGGQVDFDGSVASVDQAGRTVRLTNGSVLSVPHDGVVDPSGDYRTLAAVAGAVALGEPVRARGEAVSDAGTLRAVEIRFEVDD